MRHLALTGISKESIDDLVTKRVRTFELRSAHNIPIVFEANVSEEVFVTDTSRHDLAIRYDRGFSARSQQNHFNAKSLTPRG